MAKNEEVEKYRNENQMDYIKTIELLARYNDEDNLKIALDTIYRVTRLHIPQRVFKYYSLDNNTELNEKKFQTLVDNKIFLSSPSSLNDPYESNGYYYNSEEIMKCFDISSKDLIDFNKLKNQTIQTSFTSSGINNMPMWAHYSNNHEGFCVAYDTTKRENINLCGNMMRVQYVDTRVNVTNYAIKFMSDMDESMKSARIDNKKEVLINNFSIVFISIFLACLKHKSWEYENELRCVIASNAKGTPYVSTIPSEVFIGSKCSEANKKRLLEIADYLDIPISIMHFDEYSSNFEYIPKIISNPY